MSKIFRCTECGMQNKKEDMLGPIGSDLPRTPEGHINNCAVQNGGVVGDCQMCDGICPDTTMTEAVMVCPGCGAGYTEETTEETTEDIQDPLTQGGTRIVHVGVDPANKQHLQDFADAIEEENTRGYRVLNVVPSLAKSVAAKDGCDHYLIISVKRGVPFDNKYSNDSGGIFSRGSGE